MTESKSRRKRGFNALFASYSSDVVAHCSWRAGSRSDSQDAVADVFLTAWRRLDDVPDGDAAGLVVCNGAESHLQRQATPTRPPLVGVGAD